MISLNPCIQIAQKLKMDVSQTKACGNKTTTSQVQYLLKKLRETCNIKYAHNYVEQKVSNAITSVELDARVVYG